MKDAVSNNPKKTIDEHLKLMRDNFTNGWVWFFILVFLIGGVSLIISGGHQISPQNNQEIQGDLSELEIFYHRKNSHVKIKLENPKYRNAIFEISHLFFKVNKSEIKGGLEIGDEITLTINKDKYDNYFNINLASGVQKLSNKRFEIYGLRTTQKDFFGLSDYENALNENESFWKYFFMPLGVILAIIQIFMKNETQKLKISGAILISILLWTLYKSIIN